MSTICVKPTDIKNKIECKEYNPINYWGAPGRGFYINNCLPPREIKRILDDLVKKSGSISGASEEFTDEIKKELKNNPWI